jgi:tetratricopeptide (TPR) repeat protein
MGSLCHLAGEFPLSYDMYERSANMFLRNGDTLNYYHGLNEMAFESAEQGKEEETLQIIKRIIDNCCDKHIVAQTFRTKTVLYRNLERYDLAISALDSFQLFTTNDASIYVLKAQLFWFEGVSDSALFYAQYSLTLPGISEQDQYNMYFIVLDGDSTLNPEEIKALSNQRADLEMLRLVPLHKQNAVAANLLEQDLTHKPDLRWLYATIITLLIVGLSLIGYIHRKRKKQELLAQKLHALKTETSSIQEKHEELSQRYLTEQQRITSDVMEKCVLLGNEDQLKNVLAWNDFETMCHNIDQHFYLFATKLRSKHVLNETEIRLCILVLLDMNRMDISKTLPYALNSVGKLKDHTAKLLGTTGKNLRSFLLKMVIEG